MKITHKKYFAILGEKPSQGARSPKLWNKVLKELDRKERMIPIDIKKKDLSKTIIKLEKDENFLGGCIAVPYKEDIFKLLKKNINKKNLNAQSINCLYRDKKGKLTGCNTDGLAAVHTLNKFINNQKNKTILLIGLGGTGKAISASLKNKGFKRVTLTSRNFKKKNFSEKLGYSFLKFTEIPKNIERFDLIINATSVGFLENKSPIDIKILSKIKNKFFFDVIYQPKLTLFLKSVKKRNKIINGLHMNLMQAVMAFSIVVKIKNNNRVYKIMSK